MKLALYKGTRPGVAGLYNRLGRALSHGPYSHVEVVFRDRKSASASFADGGFRIKPIGYSSKHCWDFLTLPDALEPEARKRARDAWGIGYDVWGNVHFALGMVKDSRDKLFCSEGAALMLQWRDAWRYCPNSLAARAMDQYGSVFCDSPWAD